MKRCVFVLLLLSPFVASQWDNKEDEIQDATVTCLAESGVTTETVRNYKAGQEEPSEEVLCFIKCTFTKLKFIDDEGGIALGLMRQRKFPEGSDELRERIYGCVEGLPRVETCHDVAAMEACFVAAGVN